MLEAVLFGDIYELGGLFLSKGAILFFVMIVPLVWMFVNRRVPAWILGKGKSIGYFVHPSYALELYRLLLGRGIFWMKSGANNDWIWCYKMLDKTSRSFSKVITLLPLEIRNAVCLFYLVLRGLDTVEDDMRPDVNRKKMVLVEFHTHLQQLDWNLTGFGVKSGEMELLHNFCRVTRCYAQIAPEYQKIIGGICKEMGEGMAMFLSKSIDTIEDWELYCYYVSGLVGCGLSEMFYISGLEKRVHSAERIKGLSIYMAFFLQKTNIIRDFLEDITDVTPRIFWPREIWGKYVERVYDLSKHCHNTEALKCLNEIITDVMKHPLDCLEYLKCLKDESIFKFSALPQVMAIATLSLCYNNYDVFLYSLKIPRTESLEIITRTKSFENVLEYFRHYSEKMLRSIPHEDPNALLMEKRLRDIIGYCNENMVQNL